MYFVIVSKKCKDDQNGPFHPENSRLKFFIIGGVWSKFNILALLSDNLTIKIGLAQIVTKTVVSTYVDTLTWLGLRFLLLRE